MKRQERMTPNGLVVGLVAESKPEKGGDIQKVEKPVTEAPKARGRAKKTD